MSNGDLPIGGLSATDMLGALGVGAAPAPPRPGAKRCDQALQQAAKDFESILIYQLLDAMKNTIPESGLTGGSETRQMQGLFWSFLAGDLSNKGGLGLSRDLYAQWSRAAATEDTGARVESSR